MILTIPTIYLEDGKSKYSISGLPEFVKLESYFKNNPVALAKLFREENSKSILALMDSSNDSFTALKTIVDNLDIPVQVLLPDDLDPTIVTKLKGINIKRIFSRPCYELPNCLPIYNYSQLDFLQGIKEDRILLDMQSQRLTPIHLNNRLKISIINSICDTNDLIELNKSNSNIDSVFLGKEYYGTHYAGQSLWRIAEKHQFSL